MAAEHQSAASFPLVVELQEGLDPLSVGAKSANLSRLIERGLRVPPGGVVTRQALRLFLEHTDLLKSVQGFIEDSEDHKPTDRTQVYEDLCRQVLAAPMPQPLIDAMNPVIEGLLVQVPSGLAVRSSGAQEDSDTASFAGVYESYLGVQSPTDLWMAIRRCWCAAWAPTAVAYAKKMGITPEPDAMAVLVQQLVDADSAGVVFTADPRTGNPWRFILESTFGLAQDLVGAAGTVPADRFMLEWDTGAILEKKMVEKPTQCVPAASGVETVPLSIERMAAASLEDETAIHIAQLALEIDRLFECRVDIEWVIIDGEVSIVQARPLTALPLFFPYHLPLPMADQTWQSTRYGFFFSNWQNKGNATPPLYCDLSITEKDNRYYLGPVGMVLGSYDGADADFNGHRYLARKPVLSQFTREQQEAYLREYEPALRRTWIDVKQRKYPTFAQEADVLRQEAHSLQQQLEAILWAREVSLDIQAISAGPTNYLYRMCVNLLEDFMTQYMPDYSTDDLMQGYHPDLDPYYPLVYVAQAEQLAQYIGKGAVHRAFEQCEMTVLLADLVDNQADSPFMQAFEGYCEHFSLLPPSRFSELDTRETWPNYSTELHIVQASMRGKESVITIYEQATRRRQECEAEVRQVLSEKAPDALPRFKQLLDWSLFWGSAVNDRGSANVPGYRIGWLVTAMRHGLQRAGLIEEPADIGYFTAEDLALIAQTGDLEDGRKTWQQRRREYERNDRLHAPEFLGEPPVQPIPSDLADEQEQIVAPVQTEVGSVIQGQGLVVGQASGTAHKIESLEEEHTVTDQDVLLFTKPINPTAGYTPFLLSLMLRVQGMVTQEHLTNTTHIIQIARECGVPIVEISPAAMARIPDGSMLSLDGSDGTVIIHT